MDKNGAFSRYACILKDAEDWLISGYRSRKDNDTMILSENRKPNAKLFNNEPQAASIRHSPVFDPPAGVEYGKEDAVELNAIAQEIRTCESCSLYLLRKNTVPGKGSAGARLMVVTPPPIDDAHADSMPMSTQENEYLMKWLAALGLNPHQDTFITPAVKCRTPGSRPPKPKEVEACVHYLHRQYRSVAPMAVLALGDAACGALSGDPRHFPALVGKDWRWGTIPALILWTPGEVLAHPERLRRPVWESLQRFKASWDVLSRTGL